jgi:hypothetical protein
MAVGDDEHGGRRHAEARCFAFRFGSLARLFVAGVNSKQMAYYALATGSAFVIGQEKGEKSSSSREQSLLLILTHRQRGGSLQAGKRLLCPWADDVGTQRQTLTLSTNLARPPRRLAPIHLSFLGRDDGVGLALLIPVYIDTRPLSLVSRGFGSNKFQAV